jgi:hypothetical protein
MSYKVKIPMARMKNEAGETVYELEDQEIDITSLEGPVTIQIDAYYDANGNPILKVRKHRVP